MKKLLLLCLFASMLVGAPKTKLVQDVVRRNQIIKRNRCLDQTAQAARDCVVGCASMNVLPIAAAIGAVLFSYILKSLQVESSAL